MARLDVKTCVEGVTSFEETSFFNRLSACLSAELTDWTLPKQTALRGWSKGESWIKGRKDKKRAGRVEELVEGTRVRHFRGDAEDMLLKRAIFRLFVF